VSAHGPHEVPPQSTSVSSPDFDPSVHDGGGAAQRLCSQMPLMQSVATRQPEPIAHGRHAPPQSTPLSLPFFSVSVQLGSAHCPCLQ